MKRKADFYPKLALSGIRKNKRLYTPYILTCIGMVAMYYIIAFLATTELFDYVEGGEQLQTMLGLGCVVIAVFSVIFLFYTNSFLMRRRMKEFGLYNILGMGKRNLGLIVLWETIVIAILSLIFGIGAGIALSKLAELGLINIMNGEVSYSFQISVQAIGQSGILFSVIFGLILLNSLRQIQISNPITLLRSENSGEKPPKANWFLGVAGALLLGGAYYLAVSIEEPLSAFVWFFVAVIMVIIATYLLFISGSVLLCRILQKNKKFYYKATHFVSVSSMAYRMKRNGAGLASICILGTMVLVMITGSACLYFGAEDSLHTRYPRDITVNLVLETAEAAGEEQIAVLREGIEAIIEENQVDTKNLVDYRYTVVTGYLADGILETDVEKITDVSVDIYAEVYQIYLIPLSDYNRIMGKNESLKENQAMIGGYRGSYRWDSLRITDGRTFEIVKGLDEFFVGGFSATDILPSLFVVVPDFEDSLSELMQLKDYRGASMAEPHWYYGYDTSADKEVQIAMKEQIRAQVRDWTMNGIGAIEYSSIESLAAERGDFYGTYGGIFFLGIMLSMVFLFAAVLIIYYKQISEGYEDQARFVIMKKVGMTGHDIRKSVNSQMLTVFFLPFLTAVVHLAFAFPMIHKLLMLFSLTNEKLLIATAGISVLSFGVFYTVVYRITSNAYYAIVSGEKNARAE